MGECHKHPEGYPFGPTLKRCIHREAGLCWTTVTRVRSLSVRLLSSQSRSWKMSQARRHKEKKRPPQEEEKEKKKAKAALHTRGAKSEERRYSAISTATSGGRSKCRGGGGVFGIVSE